MSYPGSMRLLALLLAMSLPAASQPIGSAADVARAEQSFRVLGRAARDLDDVLVRARTAAVRREATEADVNGLVAAARAYHDQAADAARHALRIAGCDEDHCGRAIGVLRDEARRAERAHERLDSDWAYARSVFLKLGLVVSGFDALIKEASGKVRAAGGSASTCR